VLKVAKADLTHRDGSFYANPPVKCPCGFVGVKVTDEVSEKGLNQKKATSFSDMIRVLVGIIMCVGILAMMGTCVYRDIVPESPAAIAARKAADRKILSENSAWDGSVHWVNKYLQKTLKDPDSYQAIEWSAVQPGVDGTLRVRHKYRAKNSFGGYVIENQFFTFKEDGTVLSVIDLP
jgi:hypothetical protein